MQNKVGGDRNLKGIEKKITKALTLPGEKTLPYRRINMPKYIDLSLPVHGSFDFNVRFQKVSSYENNGTQLTGLSLAAHSCTYLDAP